MWDLTPVNRDRGAIIGGVLFGAIRADWLVSAALRRFLRLLRTAVPRARCGRPHFGRPRLGRLVAGLGQVLEQPDQFRQRRRRQDKAVGDGADLGVGLPVHPEHPVAFKLDYPRTAYDGVDAVGVPLFRRHRAGDHLEALLLLRCLCHGSSLS